MRACRQTASSVPREMSLPVPTVLLTVLVLVLYELNVVLYIPPCIIQQPVKLPLYVSSINDISKYQNSGLSMILTLNTPTLLIGYLLLECYFELQPVK